MVLASEEEQEDDGGGSISRLKDTAAEAALPYPASLAVSKATSRSRRKSIKDWNRGK
ncbi:uncharacterized protein LOC112084091 [Eutrema salsugineum]|uniref:uncharacterized protein LOC112084091 n=1 Tax=Eutrema salsugineum TaxID=72664 RepID=UPI000CECEED8|nr:uncharacterized protein LOC112084091 [Eutrema salsugineum]